jgi:hypothetical protein
MELTEVKFIVYSGEAYDRAFELVRSSPGWHQLWIDDIEAYSEDDPLAEMTVYFDSEQHAMLFRLKMSV